MPPSCLQDRERAWHFTLAEGQEVIVSGTVDVYEKRRALPALCKGDQKGRQRRSVSVVLKN